MNPLYENPLSWMYFPTALLLGALHALEPGHAKTLTAAYLIGIKGTKRDAFFLGLSVALTHSIVVIAISVVALWVGKETFTQDITHWLQIGSGIIVVLLGAWLMVKRIIHLRHQTHHHLHHHSHAEPILITNSLISGILEIINTNEGKRIKFTSKKEIQNLNFKVIINRPEGLEVLKLNKLNSLEYLSDIAPSEPHEFSAEFEISQENKNEIIPFEMHEQHLLDEHERAHAASIPEYAKKGMRPTLWQIITFGAAGGMIPCPASISVMLLALSIGQLGSGLLAVAGFSIGLAITLVGIGLIVVAGLSKLQGSGKFNWISSKAPIISAAVVMLSGIAAILFSH